LEVGGQGVVSSSAARGDVVDDCVDGVCVGVACVLDVLRVMILRALVRCDDVCCVAVCGYVSSVSCANAKRRMR